MKIQVNCTSFREGGACAHQAAPRRLFGPSSCVVWLHEKNRARLDPRAIVGAVTCNLCVPNHPDALPSMPYPGEAWFEGAAVVPAPVKQRRPRKPKAEPARIMLPDVPPSPQLQIGATGPQ